MSGPSFEKKDNGVEEADLGNIQKLEFDLEFKQVKSGGMFGGFKDKYKPADPDLVAVAFAGILPVDYVEPKSHHTIFDGAAKNLGDARGEGTETVRLDVNMLSHRNRDITGFVVAASCADGFGRVNGVVCHVYDTSKDGEREHLTACRFDMTQPNITSGIFGALVLGKTGGWLFRKFNAYGRANGWHDIAAQARSYMQ